jgi:phosphatidylserine/phosphatidylglycerophosphate/cardiolipin synthase-like enzyme
MASSLSNGSPRRKASERANGHAPERVVIAPGQRREAVVAAIATARRELRMAIFRCDDFAVLDALADAMKRGVRLRLLLTSRAKGWKKKLGDLLTLLENMGAEVRSYADPVVKYHAKYLVADRKLAAVASLNFTQKCFADTCDFLLVSEDRKVVDGLTRLFDADWNSPDASFPPDLGDRLIVGPEEARDQMTALLAGAERSIRIIDHKLTDPALVTLLKQRRKEGLTVDVKGEDHVAPLRSHGKLVVVDERIAVIGSMALSALSLGFRREVAVAIRHPRLVRELNAYYHSLTPGAPVPDSRASRGSP